MEQKKLSIRPISKVMTIAGLSTFVISLGVADILTKKGKHDGVRLALVVALSGLTVGAAFGGLLFLTQSNDKT